MRKHVKIGGMVAQNFPDSAGISEVLLFYHER
jgi:hypothetical protein